jgi:threonine/homoserine/homoserine lactone efflux protein
MIEAILKGFALSLLLVISVGPVVFAIFKQSINNGHAGGFSFVAGVLLSDILWVVLANVFSSVMISLLNHKQVIGFCGSIFLIALGVYYLFFKKVHLKEDEDKIVIRTRDHAKIALYGFLINTLNPGVIFFWLTTSTTIAAAESGDEHAIRNRIIVFSTCILLNTGVDVLKVLLAGKIRSRINERVIRMINKISGLILIGFGVALMIGVFYATRIAHHGT